MLCFELLDLSRTCGVALPFSFGELFSERGRLISKLCQPLLRCTQTLNQAPGAGLVLVAERIDYLLQLIGDLRFSRKCLTDFLNSRDKSGVFDLSGLRKKMQEEGKL